MSDDDAQRLDGDVLGEDIGDDGLPGVGDYPPDQALGVNDPNLVAGDDVAMREARTRHDPSSELHLQPAPAGERGRVGDLVPPDGDDGHRDTVAEAVASEGRSDRGDVPAEVDAVRTEDDVPRRATEPGR